MKRMIGLMICVAAMILSAAAAMAQPVQTYTFGGSGRDWLYDIAVSDNGHIALTGWTESSDGTLKTRTKTGRSGWLLIIDSEGKEIVNFCTRLGNHDNLSHPVFHEDGTLTVMLFAEDANTGWVKYELIRLNMDGEVLSREVVAQKGGNDEHFISIVGQDERGYLFQERSFQGEGYTCYDLISYDAEDKGQLASWHRLVAAADGHAIRYDEEEDEAWLYRRDAQGNEEKQSFVFAARADSLAPLAYNGLVTLPDGGAAGAGWVLDEGAGEKTRLGLFTRWNAQGNIVCEMRTPGVFFGDLTLIPGGFAATAYPISSDGWFDFSQYSLYLFDEKGALTGTAALGEMENIGPYAPVAAMGDGTIVTVKVMKGQSDDSVVMIVRP